MPAPKRNDQQTQDDLTFIAAEVVKSTPIRQICALLNERNEQLGKGYTLAHSMVAYDIKKILEEWREERKNTIDLMVDRDLRKLDVIELESWQAWEASKSGKKITKLTGGELKGGKVSGSKIKERSVEDSNGDPRYLNMILVCMQKRQDLLGYAAAKKVEFSGSVSVGVAPMAEDDIRKEKERILKNLKIA